MSSRYVWERYNRGVKYNTSLSWSSADEYSDWLPTSAGNPPDGNTDFWRVANNYTVDPDTGIVSFSDLYENENPTADYQRYVGGDVIDYQFLFLAGNTIRGAGTRDIYRAYTDSATPTWRQGSNYVVSVSLDYLIDRVRQGSVTSYDTQGSTNYGPVSSANSGAYPSNNYSGNYWYKLQGSDTIDPAAVTLPAGIFGGDTVTVTVTPSAGKVYGGTVRYTYQYRLDGGAWQALATTTETSQTITVPKGTSTVEVQVCAQDDLGFTSAAWVSSGAVSVTNNLAPTAPGSIQVSGVVAGDSVTVTLTPAADPDGSVSEYIIQRQIDGGDWTQVQRSAALTFTQTVSGDWSTLAFRAAAVDNEGAQGPYITSETLPVSRGAVTITGPEADQGIHSGPFDLTVTLGITGSPQTPDLHFSAALDGVEAVSAAHQAGDQITLRLYPQAMPRGAHVLKVTATKEDYMAASQSYTYTIPEWDGSDIEGGWSGVIQDPTGQKLLPKTLAQDCLGPGGKDMATLITELKQQMGQLSPAEDVIRQAPPSGSFELAPGTLYDFTQAAAADLTFTLGAAEGTRAAAYHVLFQSGSTPTAVHLPEGIRTPDGYAIEAGRVYELSILENLLTFQSWEAST